MISNKILGRYLIVSGLEYNQGGFEMEAESKIEDVAVTLAEIVLQLKNKYPKTLSKVLEDIDLSDEALDEYLAILK
jgi:hypothetical protein